jgi:hypothetical protein
MRETTRDIGRRNEKEFMRLLSDPDYWKPNMTKINKLMGFNQRKTGIRVRNRLRDKGLVDSNFRPVVKSIKIDVSGTNTDGAIL